MFVGKPVQSSIRLHPHCLIWQYDGCSRSQRKIDLNFIIKISSKEMHHPRSFNRYSTNNRFHAKNNSAFKRVELQLLPNWMPSRFSIFSTRRDFALRDSMIYALFWPLLKTTPHISALHEQNLIKICTQTRKSV